MGLPIPNIFTSYSLSHDEEAVAQTLNHLQKQYLHNCRAEVAESKLQLKVDPTIPGGEREFFLNQAFKDGMIAAYTALIDLDPSQDNSTIES